ncbi:MAG: hypothetical protein F6K62_23460 [Sphaerospermopsis sp. SIO1G2]|nr:hypothetical protein [Sphaerospermopsis sp. SIO1G2]
MPAPTRQGLFGLVPGLKPWNGWYNAIADLLHFCEDAELADWQKRKLPQHILDLLEGDVTQEDTQLLNGQAIDGDLQSRSRQEPAFTITASHNTKATVRALVNHQGYQGHPIHQDGAEPAFTITNSHGRVPLRAIVPANNYLINDQTTSPNGRIVKSTISIEPAFTITTKNQGAIRAIFPPDHYLIPSGNASSLRGLLPCEPSRTITTMRKEAPAKVIINKRSDASDRGSAVKKAVRVVVRLKPRCMARLQAFPDSYHFFTGSPAYTIIGNAVPPKFVEILYRHLLA